MHKLVRLEADTVKEELRAEIRNLPTKDEFFTRMDKLSAEIEKVRLSQDFHNRDHEVINNRLEHHDKLLGVTTAP